MRFLKLTLVAVTLLVSIATQPVHADDVPSRLQNAAAAANRKDWDAALVELDAAIALDKNNVDAHYGRAVMLANKQDVKGAITELDRVIEIDPKNAAAYKMRASFYMSIGDAAKSQADFVMYLTLTPDEAAKLQAAAQQATDKKEWKRAINFWSMLAKVRPNDASVLYAQGMAFIGYDPALSKYFSGHSVDDMLADRKSKDDIEAIFEAAIKADPKFVPAYLALASIMDNEDIVRRNHDALDQGLKLMPDNVELLIARGHSIFANVFKNLSETGTAESVKAALKDFNHALELDPKNASALAGCAEAYVRGSQDELAFAASNRALELQPDNIHALEMRAIVYDHKKDFERESADYVRILALGSDDAERMHVRLYEALNQMPDKSHAFAFINKTIEDNPDNPFYRQSRADLYFDQKDFARALIDLDKVLNLDPTNESAAKLRAKIFAAQILTVQ